MLQHAEPLDEWSRRSADSYRSATPDNKLNIRSIRYTGLELLASKISYLQIQAMYLNVHRPGETSLKGLASVALAYPSDLAPLMLDSMLFVPRMKHLLVGIAFVA